MSPIEKRFVEICKVYNHTDRIKSFYLKLLDQKSFDYQAGQFIIAHIPKPEGMIKRAYSLASAPHETKETGLLEICLNKIEFGNASTWLHQSHEKTKFEIDGPHGKFMIPDPPIRDLIFCATGIGIAPIRGMIMDLYQKGCLNNRKVWLFFGVRHESEILYHQDFF